MRLAGFTLLLNFTLLGCASSNRSHVTKHLSAQWKTKDFRVYFQAGPEGSDSRSFSYYEITPTTSDPQKPSLIMESAHSLEGFSCVTNGNPKNWIRIIEDSNTKALIIEEVIPNDCGPCSNYLWVHLDSESYVEGKYLKLPSEVTGPPGGIDYEYPKVRSLHGDVLIYDYSIGGSITKRFDQIEKVDRPTPPG